MTRGLKGLLGLATREDATVAELAPSLPVAEAELTAAGEAQAAAEASYRAALLTADDVRPLQLDAARREAAVRIDRATALVDALRQRLAAAEAREAEAARVQRYQAAQQQADDAAAALAEMYPTLARTLVDLLEGVTRAEIEVRAVNKDLPRGMERIPAVERRVRDIPSAGRWASPIAEALALPGFRAGERDFFRPVTRPMEGSITPEDVLGRIVQLRT